MTLTHRLLNDADKRLICQWQYEGEYSVYNLPSYDKMKEKAMGFMKPQAQHQYYGFLEAERLVGFVNILEEENEVFIGIGVDPALCNQHYGQRILQDTYQISKQLYPQKPLYLEVRSWNLRAIRCYQKAGFQIEGEAFEMTTGMGKGIFYRMIKP